MALPITEGRTFKNSVITPQTILQNLQNAF